MCIRDSFYPSPNRDNGYDVTDYYNVHEKHGSLGDFVNFINHAEALGLRVIVDLVANHTSVDCPWFQDARRSPHSFYRDWYVWSDIRPNCLLYTSDAADERSSVD